jgi:hypothetical protein
MKMRLIHGSIQVLAARRFLPAIPILLLACLAVLPERAGAAVFDDFESYAVGSNLHRQGGWAGWLGDTNAGALISSNFSFSPTRSVNITGASDLVRTFSGATNGQWVFSVMQYIPSTSSGTNYVVLMNTYRSPYGAADLSYSVQIQNNMATGLIISDRGGSATRPMVKNQWVEVRCEINLASTSVSEFYNGQLLSTHAWQDSSGSNQIQALDLFANNAGPVYYDNVSLAAPTETVKAVVRHLPTYPHADALAALRAMGVIILYESEFFEKVAVRTDSTKLAEIAVSLGCGSSRICHGGHTAERRLARELAGGNGSSNSL